MRDFSPTLIALRRLTNQLDWRLMSEAQVRPLTHSTRQASSSVSGPEMGAGPALEAWTARNERPDGTPPEWPVGVRPQHSPEQSRMMLPAGLAVIGVCGIAALALLASRAAEPLVLTIMAGLATIGVFFLFALAAKHVRIGQPGSDGELLRCIVEADDSAVLVTDATGRELARNRAFAALTGQHATGIAALEGLVAADATAAEALFRLNRAADRGAAAAEELYLAERAQQSGGGRWLRLSIKPMAVPGSGRTMGRIWRVEDVTAARGQIAAAVDALESRLSRYADAPVGLLVADADGRIHAVNERLAGWLGYASTARMAETRLTELIADGGAHVVTSLQPDASSGTHRIDLDLVCESGRRWPATLLVTPGSDHISIAVCERGEEEDAGNSAATHAPQPRYSRFFQSAPFGIAAVDGDGRIVSANAAFARLLLDGTSHRGNSLLDVLDKSDPEIAKKVAAALADARDGKAAIPPFDIRLGAKGKELTRKVYTASLARGGKAREVAILYVIDVTEAKALEEKFSQAQKMEAVGTLAGGIAHDFNNVLTAIIGFSDLLLQTHKPGNASYSHILSVKSSANRAAGLVRQLLAFSRRQTMQPKVLQIGDLLTDWSMLVNRLLGEKIELKINTGRDLWHVKADPGELERIIINLAVNARDAMLPKGGRLTIRTRNISERDSQKLSGQGIARAEYVLIEVEDSGCGMTPEVMAKIFDPFFTTKAVGKGTGLGLASVYGIVQQTGGYIIPESTPGEGTTFRLYLPRHHAEPDEEAAPAAAAKKPRARDLTGNGRVLLVEDEEAVRRFAVAALKSKGYEVLQAADGVEAMEVMAEHDNKVDIVVSDVIMPEMDGPALMRELRKIDPKLKFIFVSGYPDDHFKNSLDPDADFTFLPKPYNLAQLAAKVKEQIAA
jgi:two-component system cell cycle sensor histidine kinase/response regulator CckA